MRRHNHLAVRFRSREHCSLTERQFLMVVEHSRKDRMTNSNAIYAGFEALEEHLAHCYFLLHQRFIEDPPLAKFWLEAALDELQHSSTLRFCSERGIFANVNVGVGTAEHVDMLLDTVKKIVSD